jgi:predicted PurR-regulated permease PerM
MQTYEHPFSWQALIRIIITGFTLFIAWKAIDIFISILIALIISVALYPIIAKLNKKLPKIVSILSVLLILLIPFGIIITAVIRDFTSEFPNVLHTINSVIQNSSFLANSIGTIHISEYIQNYSGYLLNSTKTIVLTVTSILTVGFMSFYFLFDFENLFSLTQSIFPEKNRLGLKKLLTDLSAVVGGYIRGTVFISFVCGAVIYIGLTLLNVPFALPLAIFAAIMDLLPLVGSTIGSVPALILGFAISPTVGISTALLYIIYQQIENVFIAPIVYNKTLSLSSSLIFLAVVIGGSVFGITGAFLALPVAASIPVILKHRQEYLKN